MCSSNSTARILSSICICNTRHWWKVIKNWPVCNIGQQNYWVSSIMTLFHEKIIIDFICKKVQHIVYLLQHSRYVLDRATARTLYFQFVYCHLINGIHVYGNLSNNNDLNKFFILQKWALHIIPIVHYIPFYFIPTDSITQSSKILPLPKLVYYFTLIFSKKIYNL